LRRVGLDGGWTLSIPGRATASFPRGPELWTELDDAARGFSGTAVYRAEFTHVPASGDGRSLLDLGRVADIARVRVNGIDCGVAWTTPFRVDISHAVTAGRNDVEVEVANPWRNRLIAEASVATGELFAPMTHVFERTAAPQPAGLAGPVAVVTEMNSDQG
jgi:hypothetical protein